MLQANARRQRAGASHYDQGERVKFTPVTCCAAPTVTDCVALANLVAAAAIV